MSAKEKNIEKKKSQEKKTECKVWKFNCDLYDKKLFKSMTMNVFSVRKNLGRGECQEG